MNHFKYWVLFSTLFVFSNCSTNVTETNSTNTNIAGNTALTSATNSYPANSPLAQPGMVPARGIENLDPNAFNAKTDANIKVVTVDPKNDKQTSGIYGRTAPDDSTFKATMDAQGVIMEVRTFINNPYLIKVEKVFTTPNKKMRIYLKNGKVVEVSEEKLPNFAATAPGTILEAAGVDLSNLQKPGQGDKSNPVKKQ